MNTVLDRWNRVDEIAAIDSLLSCCAARRWAAGMVARRPISSLEALSTAADDVWSAMRENDWLEAFASHPRIGQRGHSGGSSRSAAWSGQEQASVRVAGDNILAALAEGNASYERQFGFTYIVCATGKSADEMLETLQRRLANDRVTEMREAAEQQRQIMQIRLRKWVDS